MQQIDVTKRTIGLNISDTGKVNINIWSPLAQKVSVISGDLFIPLQKAMYGYWQATTDKLKEGSQYKIQIDDKEPLPDPASLYQPEDVHGPSEIANLQHDPGQPHNWPPLPLEEYIIYELHVGTFTNEGTFAAIETKLDYLKELGINAIEIMPVAQFPGNRNWGYDGVYPYAVDNSYGGPKALQHFVDACHQKGIAVILDVVYNHQGPEGNYMGEFGPYFTDKYQTPWGKAINFDDQWCDGVRRFYIENALMWFRDFHIDALRLDAVHAIKDTNPVHVLKELRMRIDELMNYTGNTHYLIVEMDLNDTTFINPVEKGGYGMDAQWIDEFHHALRVTTGQPQTGYYSDFTGINHLAKSYRDAYVYDGQWSPHRHKFFGIPATENEGRQFIVFSQNHDQIGNRMLGERTSQLVSFEMQKVLAGAVLLSPYLPMLFMGEEWSEPNPFLYFVSHTDLALAEAVRTGRKAEFAAFHKEGEAPDPVATKTFLDSKLQWYLKDKGHHNMMLDYYKHLIRLRKENSVLKALNRKNLTVTVENQTLILHRWQHQTKLVCIMNYANHHSSVNIHPSKERTVLLDSADEKWGGPGTTFVTEHSVQMPPETILVLQYR